MLRKIHIPKIPGSPPAAAKIAKQNPLLRTTENPYIRYYVPLQSLYPLLRATEILISVTAHH